MKTSYAVHTTCNKAKNLIGSVSIIEQLTNHLRTNDCEVLNTKSDSVIVRSIDRTNILSAVDLTSEDILNHMLSFSTEVEKPEIESCSLSLFSIIPIEENTYEIRF